MSHLLTLTFRPYVKDGGAKTEEAGLWVTSWSCHDAPGGSSAGLPLMEE